MRKGIFWTGFLACWALWLFAYAAGVFFPADGAARAFLDKPNWFLYPVFWLIVWWLVTRTWDDYETAWRDMAAQGPLTGGVEGFGRFRNKLRLWAFGGAVVVSSVINMVDSGCLMACYDHPWRDYPPFLWGVNEHCGEDVDMFIAFRHPEFYEDALWATDTARTLNGWFAFYAYLLQLSLIVMGWMALLQIAIHQSTFGLLARESYRAKLQVALDLDMTDPLRECGIAVWNTALNRTYVFISVAMIVPIISHGAQAGGEAPDVGQVMLQVFVPLLFLVPIGLGLAGRQAHFERAKHVFRKEIGAKKVSEDGEDAFHKQGVWPFDQNVVGKAAFGVILVEYAFLSSNAPAVIKGFVSGVAKAVPL